MAKIPKVSQTLGVFYSRSNPKIMTSFLSLYKFKVCSAMSN